MKDKKILIVDFDEESLASLSNLVLEEGFQVVTASDGLSGYEKFKADDFDLVILEPMLPKLHGFELCKKITQDPLKKTPIIVVTGIYREPSCKLEALQVYGASAFFTKPWNKDDLRSKMLQLLVESKENKFEKPAEPRVPARSAASGEREMLISKPVPREPKMSKDNDEIEKELQAAVASFAIPVRKKEIKEKKTEPKLNVDKEIEAMLKGAIGELGLEERKKKVETARPELKIAAELKRVSELKAVKPEPLLKSIPLSRPEPWSEKKERITIAKGIKERIPPQERAGNNIPHSSARARLDAERAPFGIDRTLIEIDKIPLDQEKAPVESERAPFEAEKAPAEKKSVIFDEYAEPRKKKSAFLVIGGLVAAIFLVSSGTFYILKSKKANQARREMASSVQLNLPNEFTTRQNEITASQATKDNEDKLESKKAADKPAPQQASDPVQQLQPALPPEAAPVRLKVQQPIVNSESASPKSNQPATTETNINTQETASQQPDAQPEVSEPAPATAKEGDLIPMENVDAGPVQMKRVDPKYPSQALNMRLQGSVTVNALIDEKGNVIRTEILKGIKGGEALEKAAEYAIKQWKFRPAQKDGVNVKVWKAFEFNFKVNMPVKE